MKNQRVASILVAVSVVVVFFCVLVICFPSLFIGLNNRLQNAANVISYTSMVFAALALVVAGMAYKVAVVRPDLHVRIRAWGPYGGVVLARNPETGEVPFVGPSTSWQIWLENVGDAAARYPIVEIIFKGTAYDEVAFEGWTAVHHLHSYGWYGYQWSPGHKQIVPPGFTIELPRMFFDRKHIPESFELEVVIAADGFEKRTYNIPVEIINVDY